MEMEIYRDAHRGRIVHHGRDGGSGFGPPKSFHVGYLERFRGVDMGDYRRPSLRRRRCSECGAFLRSSNTGRLCDPCDL